MKNLKFKATIEDIIELKLYCPLDLSVIPNHMGINLCSVESIEWEKQEDGQLINLKINFIPNNEDKK